MFGKMSLNTPLKDLLENITVVNGSLIVAHYDATIRYL